MDRKIDKRIKAKKSADGKRTDRVKKVEREHMVKLRDKGKTIAEIAGECKRNERTVSKQLSKAEESRQRNERMFDPIISEAKKKHFIDMAAIADSLLSNGLDLVRKHPNSRGTEEFQYSTMIGDSLEVLSHEQLGDRLRVNIGLQWARMSAEDTKRFLAHLKAGYHELKTFSPSLRRILANW